MGRPSQTGTGVGGTQRKKLGRIGRCGTGAMPAERVWVGRVTLLVTLLAAGRLVAWEWADPPAVWLIEPVGEIGALGESDAPAGGWGWG